MLKPSAVVELVMQDASGSTSAITLSAPSSATVDDIDASATALASIIVPLSGATLIKQRIRYISVSDEPVSASGGASVLRTGAFFFDTADGAPLAIALVKAIKDSLIVDSGFGDGVLIDTEDSDIVTFVNALIDGGYTNVFGDDIVGLATAYLQSRL